MLLLVFWTPRSQEIDLVVLADIDAATRSAFEFSTIYRRLQIQILHPFVWPLWRFLKDAWGLILLPLRYLLSFQRRESTGDLEKRGANLSTDTTSATEASALVLNRISDDNKILSGPR
jgi:hypothetical protein